MNLFTPAILIGGRIPVKKGYEREAVFHAAAGLLDTDRIQFMMRVQDGHAWYLAAPAAEFGSHVMCGTPLEAALPGSPLHRGDGAYIVELSGSLRMVVVTTGEKLKTYLGRQQQVKRFIDLEECEHIYFPTEAVQRWEGMQRERMRRASALLRLTTQFGLAANVLCALGWAGAAVVGGREQEGVEAALEAQRRALVETATGLNTDDGGTAVLREHALLVGEVLRDPANRIKRFRYENDKVSWLIQVKNMPEERLRTFGHAVDVTRLPDGGLTVEKKGQ